MSSPGLHLHLAPTTATWAAPFAIYYLFLQIRVASNRFRSGTVIGSSSQAPSPSSSSSPSKGPLEDTLYIATRAQKNFNENIPLALILGLLAEVNGVVGRSGLHLYLGTLFALRVAHVEFGLMVPGARGRGRPIAFVGTQASIAVMAGYLCWSCFGA